MANGETDEATLPAAATNVPEGGSLVPRDLGVTDAPAALAHGHQDLANGTFDPKVAAAGVAEAGGSTGRTPVGHEQVQAPEIRRQEVESVAFTIIKAEAVQACRRGDLQNPAEIALSRLGKYLTSPAVKVPGTGEPLIRTVKDGEYKGGVLEKYHPLPRLRETGDNQWVCAYDKRATEDDPVITDKGTGIVQLDTFTGKTVDGMYHFLGSDAKGSYGSEIVLSENDFVRTFLLAQTNELKNGLTPDAPLPTASSGLRKPAVRKVVAAMVGACEKFVADYREDREDGLDLGDVFDEQSVSEALKEGHTTVSKRAGLALTRSMIEHNRKNPASLTADGVAAIERTLMQTQEAIDAGIQPSAEQLYQALILVGEPGLRAELEKSSQRIQVIETRLLSGNLSPSEKDHLDKELSARKEEVESLKTILLKGTDNPVMHLLQDAQGGKMDPELVEMLDKKLASLTDPAGFFELKTDDLDDESSLASIMVKHYAIKKGVDPKEVKKWLSDFFSEHGGDIAMMLLYTFIQMAADVVKTSVDKT